MAITKKTPPLKQTVGAQYVTFATTTEGQIEFKPIYEENVEKTEVVNSVSVSDNIATVPVNGSGKVYKNITTLASSEISVEVIAFSAATRARMRGDTVTEKGLIKKGGSGERPFFAYGKVVQYYDGKYKFEWYPKCQLTANTDEDKTKEESYSAQNETLTIVALPFDTDGNTSVAYDTDNIVIEGLTEDNFFIKPILSDADLPITE